VGKIIKIGETKGLTAKNRNIKAVNLTMYIVMNATNTALDNNDVDLSAITLTLKGQIGTAKVQCGSGNLLTLVKATNYFNPNYNIAIDQATNAIELVAPAVGITAIYALPLSIPMGGILNLNDSDNMYAEINFPAGSLSDEINVDSTYLDLEFEDCQGVGVGIPIINIYPIDASSQNLSFDVPDNVQSIVFINNDKTSNLIAANVINSIEVTSDKYKTSINNLELQNLRLRYFPDRTEALARNQSFALNPPSSSDLDKCQVTLNLVSANVTAAKNFLVVQYYDFNGAYVENRMMALRKHAIINENKIKKVIKK